MEEKSRARDSSIVIRGGKPLSGVVEVRGAKNVALPLLAATLLTKKECIIDNLPLIEDVFRMIEILKKLGAEIVWERKRKLKVRCSEISPENLPCEIVGYFRGSILVLGPLLARFGKLKISPPGGCLIGARPLDTHLDAFRQLGFRISAKNGFYFFEKDENLWSRKKKEVVFREFSVTATENILLYSSFFPEKIDLKIADVDYENQELIKVLNKMGAKIRVSGHHQFTVTGSKNLKGFSHKLISDPIETGTFIIMGLATKSEITIKKAELSYLTLFLKRLKDFGARFEILKKDIIKVFPSNRIRMDKIQSLPYPGIHTDLQPELGVLATQTKGPTLIHDPLYEGRLKYLEILNKMGADIIFCDPHRAIVNGPSVLRGIKIFTPDLRAGAALIIAGLVARGETIIHNIGQIDRGYEKIEERIQKLKGEIKRI